MKDSRLGAGRPTAAAWCLVLRRLGVVFRIQTLSGRPPAEAETKDYVS